MWHHVPGCSENLAVIDYINKKGKRKDNLNIGNPFDRFKWSGPTFRELLSCPIIDKLWEDLINLYEEACQPFLRANGVPEEVSSPGLTRGPCCPCRPCRALLSLSLDFGND